MSDTPTPETDSVTRSHDETPWTPWVCAGHAKRLERERDEARIIAKMAYKRVTGLGVSDHTQIQLMHDTIKQWDKEK